MTVDAQWQRAGCPVSCYAAAFEVENQFSVWSLGTAETGTSIFKARDYRESTDKVAFCRGHKQYSAREEFRPYRALSTITVHFGFP